MFGHEFKKDTDSVPFRGREGPWSSCLVTLDGDVAACEGGMNPRGCERGVSPPMVPDFPAKRVSNVGKVT